MYNYKTEKQRIFTEEGQETFLKIRDHAKYLLRTSGAFMAQNVMNIVSGDTWLFMACVDRMVEIGEIKEITDNSVAGQHRVFINALP